jgi:hypothetical protein
MFGWVRNGFFSWRERWRSERERSCDWKRLNANWDVW